MKKTILVLIMVFLVSISMVFATDCVWKKVMESSTEYKGLFENKGDVYVAEAGKIHFSEDYATTFEEYGEKETSTFIDLELDGNDLIAVSTKAAYLVEDDGKEKKFTKFFETDPMDKFSLFVAIGSDFYGTDGSEKIIFKDGTDNEDQIGEETAALTGVSDISEMVNIDKQLWVVPKADSKLHYSKNPLDVWYTTANMGSIQDLGNVNSIGDNVYITGRKKGEDLKIKFTVTDSSSWSDYPAQIIGVEEFNALLMFESTNPFALVKLNDGSVKIYKQYSNTEWKEYGTGLGAEIVGGVSLIKMSNDKLLLLANTTGDKNALLRCEPNSKPVAKAGLDQKVFVGETVKLDGTKSFDSDGDKMSYDWQQPAVDKVMLTGGTTSSPEFLASTAGKYLFNLFVQDEFGGASSPDTVVVDVIKGTEYYLGLESETDHFSWVEGNDYKLGSVFFDGSKQNDYYLAFKFYPGVGNVVNTPLPFATATSTSIFTNKPVQKVIFNDVNSIKIASVYLKSSANLEAKGDDVTLKIRKGSIGGEVIAESTQFVSKKTYPEWVEFVFAGAGDNVDVSDEADTSDDVDTEETETEEDTTTTDTTKSSDDKEVTTDADETKDDETKTTNAMFGLSKWMAAGIVGVVLLIIIAVVVLIFLLARKK
ncbi:hypothetical protein HN695_05590 [Candidatus Woesearchaeota archaeon]|jgi:hypothetical protein|nr:hypothetical protein [Candidatus Woesearchaeota archaeon]MBT5272210.1 hypothetical protein [Candidatus Woesearchaeota archaeon]MBT6041554.1 hypothetical protein [Candidatus Woesearchaeota archaeon]MBT6336916.1 hypothetical protein [Candidatus Woesearchaeota archaeon]MBT7927786.1 hypothetical protein [Candidatus Woesearchaeota archaeon]